MIDWLLDHPPLAYLFLLAVGLACYGLIVLHHWAGTQEGSGK